MSSPWGVARTHSSMSTSFEAASAGRATAVRSLRASSATAAIWGRAVASAPSEPRAVLGRLDAAGRLVSADPELEALQRDAGSRIGEPLALPQIAAVAELARKLRTAVARPALAASNDVDIELWVRATPQGEDIALSLEDWTERAPSGPRLAAILGGNSETDTRANAMSGPRTRSCGSSPFRPTWPSYSASRLTRLLVSR